MRLPLRGSSLAALAILAAVAAHAQTLMQDLNDFADDSGSYNLITFGDTTLEGSSDTQGGIAVGGSLAVSGAWTIASQVGAGSNPSLYAAGSVSLSATTYLNNGYASTPGLNSSQWTWNSSQKELSSDSNPSGVLAMNSSATYSNTNPIGNPSPSGWNWSTVQSDMDSISTALGAAAATGTISVSSQNLVFTPPSGQTSGVVVFDLDASELSGDTYDGQTFSNISIDVPSGMNYVIDVINLCSTQTLFGSGVNFNSGTNDDALLWNFEGSSSTLTLDSGGNFYGSILAPSAAIVDDTTVDGQVVAGSFTDSGVELHDADFTPAQVLVPEASTYGWWVLGLCGAAIVRRRRPSRA